MKRGGVYKQGVIDTSTYITFFKGQIVDVIEEHEEYYIVRATFESSPSVRIDKKDLIIH
jgi:beta-xylosidase